MNHASLASKYRPQTFAEVAGQETVKLILSRAAAENRVAPAYLLSGTRGVGKTTIARIFAKALNCEHAPTAEPCNQCRACRSITQGNFVDVVEIDGASNRGIDDARRLRESIGYAPMEGRYKIFIIDEAHMLTKESFNALLKTLEEPPPQVTFIMATTEPQKFPVTIISRCQHFVFSALPESELISHLQNILQKEDIAYEENAVRLIARRAAGSVRDSMSLLGQTLALGDEKLSETSTRAVLGLVGQELYRQLLSAIQAQDCARVAALTKEMLRTGADLGFFLRELALMWRNLFLLRQSGTAALPLIDLSEDEKKPLAELAQKFELSAIHAAWQMTLEGQRQVLTCLEPSAALELLLFNLAMLPRLASITEMSRALPKILSAGGNLQGSTPAPSQNTASQKAALPKTNNRNAPTSTQSSVLRQQNPSAGSQSSLHSGSEARPAASQRKTEAPVPSQTARSAVTQEAAAKAAPPTKSPSQDPAPNATRKTFQSAHKTPEETAPAGRTPSAPPPWPCLWEDFQAFCLRSHIKDPSLGQLIKQLEGTCENDVLTLHAKTQTLYEMISSQNRQDSIRELAEQCAGHSVTIVLSSPENPLVTEGALKERMASHPAVLAMENAFNAKLVRSSPFHQFSEKP